MNIRDLPIELQQKIYIYSLPTYPFMDQFKRMVFLFEDEGFREEYEIDEFDTLVSVCSFYWLY
jgi:hypothetical protein